jgi:coatomer protein complex subunit alpha (xenin)
VFTLHLVMQIAIKNFNNEVTKMVPCPYPTADYMFFAGIAGRVLLRVEDRLVLFEHQSRRVLGEILAPRVKYVEWSADFSYVALLSKHSIIIADRNMNHMCTVSETVRVKSGAWDPTNKIFIYSTLNHIKYCLPNGDSAIVRTLDVPVYVVHLMNASSLVCLDREGKTRTLHVDLAECHFKVALEQKQYRQVMHMIRNTKLTGQAIIRYLQDKGFPEVALHFVKDEKTRFNLALACGNIEVAMNSAYEMEDEECWHRLGVEALRQGNHQVVEMAYQRTKNFERLSFLYMLTGNTEKLEKMLKISEMRKDNMGRFHNSLLLGEIYIYIDNLYMCVCIYMCVCVCVCDYSFPCWSILLLHNRRLLPIC